jgi:tetratricopeptide (TPR) repeat protein
MKKYIFLVIALAVVQIVTTWIFYNVNKSGVYYYKGKRLYEARLHSQAIPYLERAVHLKRNFFPALKALGISALSDTKYALAQESFEEILKTYPNDRFARRGLADVFTWSNRRQSALPIYEKLLEERPSDVLTMRSYADALLLDENYTKAIGLYEKFLATDPTQEDALVNLAYCLLKTGQQDKASSIMNKVEQASFASTTAAKALARFYAMNNDLENAKKYYEKALELSPKDLNALVQLAYIYNKMEQPQKAVDLMQKAVSGSPDDAILQITAANFLLWNKRYYEAQTMLTYIAKRWPNEPGSLEGLANLYYWQGNNLDAIPYLEKIVARDKEDMASYTKLAQAYASVDRKTDAANIYNNVLLAHPDTEIKVLMDAAWLNYELSDWNKADQIANKVLAQEQNNTQALEILRATSNKRKQ